MTRSNMSTPRISTSPPHPVRLPLAALIARPRLWVEAVRVWWALRRRGSIGLNADYVAWRRATAYGDSEMTESAHDLEAYLEWRRRQRRLVL